MPVAIACLALLALALSRSGIDVALARLTYDAGSAKFAWQSHPLLVRVLHDGAKTLTVVLEIVLLAAIASAYARPSRALAACRDALAYLAAASLASALVVSLLKSQSAHSCPWDLALFGGRYDYYPFLAAAPPNPGPGRCVPSGHASVGFMWIAAIYARRRLPASIAARVDARMLALAVVAFGTIVGIAQVVRGAHFVSHVVLTAATCWAVAWLVFVAWPSDD